MNKKIKLTILSILALVGLFAGTNATFAGRTPVVTCNSATIYGSVWPSGGAVDAWLEWGNNQTTVQNGGGTKVGFQYGISYNTEISAYITGLTGSTTYYYRMAVQDGPDYIPATTEPFTTLPCQAQTYTVSTYAGAGGYISPSSQQVTSGNTTSFQIIANYGYTISSVSGCNGNLSGNTFTTGAITSNCTVSASFSAIPNPTVTTPTGISAYAVSTSQINVNWNPSTGGNGSQIAYNIYRCTGAGCTANQYIDWGYSTNYQNTGLTCNTTYGYRVRAYDNSTPPTFSGYSNTAYATTFPCQAQTYTVSTYAGAGGYISPSSQQVTSGNTTSFQIIANYGYTIGSVSGCNGSLSGNTFTTGAITSNCTVSASFNNIPPQTYTVNTNVASGNGSFSPLSRTVSSGNTTSFTLIPGSGYSVGSASGCSGYLSGNIYNTGAITSNCTVSANFSAIANPNPYVKLTADNQNVTYNGNTTLRWSAINAVSCTASGTSNYWYGNVGISGPWNTGALTNTTTYNITCTGASETISASDSVTVTVGSVPPTPQGPTVTLLAYPPSIQSGGNSVLTWSSTNATSCSGSGTNSSATSGSMIVYPLTTTTYSITCTGTGGSASGTAIVYVSNNQICQDPSATNYRGTLPCDYYQPILTCRDPNATNYRGSLPCNYYQYPQTCQDPSATNYRGTLPCNYYQYYPQVCQDPSAINYRGSLPCNYYQYQSVCQDPNALNYRGTLPCTYNTYVNNQPTVNLSVDNTSVSFNGTTFVRWYTTNAASCYASDGSIGWAGAKSIGPGSFYTGSLTSGKTYTITCTNNYGSATDSASVSVRSQTTPVTPNPRPTPTSLVLITSSVDRNQPIVPTIDNTRPKPGDEINYTVNYQNIGTGAITNLTLRMNLPTEVDYMFSNPSSPTISGNTLIFNLGTLKANGQGTVTVRVRVRENIPTGTSLNFPATLSYIDPSGFPQSVNANVSAQISGTSTANETVQLGALAFLFGNGGFLPNSLLGWLLLILLIVLLVMAGRKAYYGSAVVVAPNNTNNHS